MSNQRLSKLCQSVLPTNFRQIKDQSLKIQQFLKEQLSDEIAKRVSVINVSNSEIVVAVSDSQVANYLRLHVRELQQQIHETFQSKQTLKFKTMPESLLQLGEPPAARKPASVSSETVESIVSGAQWIEDDSLRKALESLAKSLKSKG